MQSYTKNSKSPNEQSINTKIDPPQHIKAFSSVKNLIFFIDVEKKCEYVKLEDKIKSVGGTINLFLTDDVTHFITDKSKNVNDSKLLNLKGISNNSATADLNAYKINSSKTRSRVDEMIHRARLETNLSQSSLLDVALLKNIRIWDYNYANIFLNKTIKKLKFYKNNTKKGVISSIHLTEPFIKIENISNKYRPYYQILKTKWPFINLFNCELNSSKTSNQDLINENKLNVYVNETDNKVDKFGYCELCKCEYDKLSVHLQSKQHFSVASDQKNYEDLDKLIYEKFHHKCFPEQNSSEFKSKKKEIDKSMTKLQYHDYFSRSVTENEKGLCVQSKINRVTRQGANIEHNTNGCKKRKNELTKAISKSSSDIHVNLKNNLNYISEVQKCDKESENYTKDNSSLYYKVIKTQTDAEVDFKNKVNDKDITKPAIIVKFRKIRQSELSILNGEAENFMFPKTKSEIDKKEGSEPKPNKRKYSNVHTPEEKSDDKVKNNAESKKRGSTEIKPKADIKNYDYLNNFKNLNYSFECIPSNEPWYNVFRRQDTGKEHIFEFFGGTGYRKLPYEMGHIPLTQAKLYKNFCMICKNKGELNISESFSNNQDEVRVKLENDHTTAKEKYANNYKSIASSKYHNNLQHNLESHLDLQQQPQAINLHQTTINKPFKKFYLMNLDMPRKSPREHASTLAMLSCLVKKSSSSQNSVNNDSKEPTPEPLININRAILTPSVENENDSKLDYKELQREKDIKAGNNKLNKYLKRKSKSFYNERMQKMSSTALEKEIDYFLKKSYSDCLDFNNPLSYRFSNSIERNDSDSDGGDKEKFLNDVNFNDILDRSMKEDLSYNRSLLLNDGLRTSLNQKKRTINKTGWPCKKKLLTRRQKGCLTGFHHHKGVLVKKSSPWSIISNISGHEEEAVSQDFTDVLDSTTTFNSISMVNDSADIESCSYKFEKNGNCGNKLDKNDLKETSQNKFDIQENFLCYNSNEQSTLLTTTGVPSLILPINETKSRTHNIKSSTIPTTAKVSSHSISPPSSRVLRKPRGRWYRER